MDKIKLNFFPLTVQEFEFSVWRREYQQGEKREGDLAELHRNSLPVDRGNSEERKSYWISFEKMDGFDEFICAQDSNHRLTLHYLYHLLVSKTVSALSSNEYVLPDKKFRKYISYIINEHKQGQETVWLEPYYLESTRNFGFLIDFKFKKHDNVPFDREVQRLSLSLDRSYRSNRNFYEDRYQKIGVFLGRYRDKLFPIKMDASSTGIDITKTLEDLPTSKLRTKSYIFGNNTRGSSQFKGLDTNGPLEGISKEVVLVYIFQKKHKFLKEDLNNAITGKSPGILFKGLKSKIFGLTICQSNDIAVDDFSAGSIESILEEITKLKQALSDKLIMPVMIGDKNDEDTYYTMKYRLLKEKLPLQVVTSQLLVRRDSLKWSASNIALAIFSKLGGKPWKVVPSHEKSLIFGIGQAHHIEDGRVQKYFAYSVCTDSSGIYEKLSVLGRSDDRKEYLSQLKGNIIKTIHEHLGNGYTSYVLHIPFKIRADELEQIHEGIKGLVSKESIENVDFIVMKINEENKFFGFAYNNSKVPYESTYVQLSSRPCSYLIWFEGLQYHRETIYKRVSAPIHLEFYWSNREFSSDEKKKYLQDVLNLSGANWRGFNAKNLPISIYYCKLIADFIKEFPEEFDNVENIHNPWFL